MAESTDDKIRSLYPQFTAWLDHPELGGILREAAEGGWDSARLEGAIHNTTWWKTTWPQLREWQYVTSRDPGAAGKARERAHYEVDTMFSRLGVKLPDHVRGSLVEGYLGHGRDEWYLQKQIGDMLRKDHSLIEHNGELANYKNQIIQRGAQYLVGVDAGTATSWAIDQWTGAKSQQWFDSYYADQAKKRFTWLGDEIDAGTTPAEWYAPVVSSVAQQLERDPSSINLMSPEWSELLEVYDEGTGKIRPRTMGEAVRWARKQESYRFTQGAQDRASEVSEFLLRTFGKA